jgi:hypothetical protein
MGFMCCAPALLASGVGPARSERPKPFPTLFSWCAVALLACGVGPAQSERPKPFVLVTRFYHDGPYFRPFLDWYLALGIDHFAILNTDPEGQEPCPLFDEYREHITVIDSRESKLKPNLAFKRATPIVRAIPGVRWVLVVDPDEFLAIDKPTIGQFIASKLREHGRLDCIHFRWALMQWTEPTCGLPALARSRPDLPGYPRSTGLLGMMAVHKARPTKIVKTMSLIDRTKALGVHYPELLDDEPLRCLVDGTVTHRIEGCCGFKQNETTAVYRSAALVHLMVRSLADVFQKTLLTHLMLRKSVGVESIPGLLRTARRPRTRAQAARFWATLKESLGHKGRRLEEHAIFRTQRERILASAANRQSMQLIRGMTRAGVRLPSDICDASLEQLAIRRLFAQRGVEFKHFLETARAINASLCLMRAARGPLPLEDSQPPDALARECLMS